MAEDDKKRKKSILYGIRTSTKIFDPSNLGTGLLKTTRIGGSDYDNHKKKLFFEKLVISENNKLKVIFEIWMLALVGYSCFTSIF